MAGRRKKQNLTLDEQLEAVNMQIGEAESELKALKQKRKEIAAQIKEEKKEKLYEAVVKSGKSIDDILASIGEEEEEYEGEYEE